MLFPTPSTRDNPFTNYCTTEGGSVFKNIMCQPASSSSATADGKDAGIMCNGLFSFRAFHPAALTQAAHQLVQPPYTKRKILLLLFLTSLIFSTVTFASLYTFHRGFRRTVQFWRGMAPLVLKYKYVKFKAERIDHCDADELERRLNAYREVTAPKLVELILQLGGIYIKIGQGEKKVCCGY